MSQLGTKLDQGAIADAEYWRAFEAERAGVLRRRMVWCIAILLGLLGISTLGTFFEYLEYREGKTALEIVVLSLLDDLALGAMLVATLLYVIAGRPDRRRLVWVISGSTVVMMAAATFFEIRRSGIQPTDFMGEPVYDVDLRVVACKWALLVYGLFVLVPLVVIPMRWTESARIVGGCFGAYVVLVVVQGGATAGMVVEYGVLAVLIALGPVGFSWWRYQRFDAQFQHEELRGRYGELAAELVQARRLHEALFPVPIEKGPVRVRFVYEPMREIGGDFLFVHRGRDALYVVLIDVSGHGVAAALAVNRLHGELTRSFAVMGSAGGDGAGGEVSVGIPGGVVASLSAADVIVNLNTYVYLTLAGQGVFGTALCLKVGMTGDGAAVQWANAGHPAALLRTGAGEVHALGPTATMLGVLEPEVFACEERRMGLGAGDVVVAYTDGLIETRDEEGRELGASEVERVVRENGVGVGAVLVGAAARHRSGRVRDDTLVVEIGVGEGVSDRTA